MRLLILPKIDMRNRQLEHCFVKLSASSVIHKSSNLGNAHLAYYRATKIL